MCGAHSRSPSAASGKAAPHANAGAAVVAVQFQQLIAVLGAAAAFGAARVADRKDAVALVPAAAMGCAEAPFAERKTTLNAVRRAGGLLARPAESGRVGSGSSSSPSARFARRTNNISWRRPI